MLLEGVMAIQRIIDEDRIPPNGPDGRRVPLQLAIQPNYQPKPQPVPVSIGTT
jgi:hypothetical protein